MQHILEQQLGTRTTKHTRILHPRAQSRGGDDDCRGSRTDDNDGDVAAADDPGPLPEGLVSFGRD